jgi:hypothetical protein
MRVDQITSEGAIILVTKEELVTLSNALNEVCNGLDLPEFATRIGTSREEAESLLSTLSELYDRMRARS